MDLSNDKRRRKRSADSPSEAASSTEKIKKSQPVEITIEKLSTPSNANYQIAKRWNLEDGNTLTVTYENKEVVVAIGNLTSCHFGSSDSWQTSLPILGKTMGGSEIEALLNKWDEIEVSISKKATVIISTPSISKELNLIFKLNQHTQGYGMEIYNTPINGSSSDEKFLKHLFLSEASLQKITRAKKFILQHLEFLRINLDSYKIMQAEVVKLIENMNIIKTVKSYDLQLAHIVSCTEMLITMDLKKDIIKSYKEEINNREIEGGINIYSLYSFCIAQNTLITNSISTKKYMSVERNSEDEEEEWEGEEEEEEDEESDTVLEIDE